MSSAPQQIDAVQQLLNRPIPRELWHYTTLSGFQGILASRRLWATDVRFLNDLTEFVHARSIAESLIAGMSASGIEDEWVKANAEKVLKEYFEVGPLSPARLELYTVSFTTLRDTLSQWRGYGSDGVSLCFDLRHIRPPAELGSLVSLAPCVYEEDEKRAVIASALDHFLSKTRTLHNATGDLVWARKRINAWNQLSYDEQASYGSITAWNNAYLKDELNNQYFLSAVDLLRVAGLCKDHGFHEEQEWRLILPVLKDRPLKNTTRSHRMRNGENVPYITTSLFSADQLLPLTHVIVGPGGDTAGRRHLVEANLTSATYEIEVESSKVPLR